MVGNLSGTFLENVGMWRTVKPMGRKMIFKWNCFAKQFYLKSSHPLCNIWLNHFIWKCSLGTLIQSCTGEDLTEIFVCITIDWCVSITTILCLYSRQLHTAHKPQQHLLVGMTMVRQQQQQRVVKQEATVMGNRHTGSRQQVLNSPHTAPMVRQPPQNHHMANNVRESTGAVGWLSI